jgi:hypothetical protein
MKYLRLGLLVLISLAGFAPRTHAGVTVLLEEPYSYDGALAGTGHTAIYLTRVCATTPVILRRCNPGERGSVISRYTRIAGYDWIAIPLIPYLYAVENPQDIPLYADAKLVTLLRDRYRREHLEDFAPDSPGGETPKGDWYELIGSAYDRTDYGFQIETTAEQDDAFIAWMNSRANRASYRFITNNCADFVREVLNFYYPRSESHSTIADLFVSTPKHEAKSLFKYAKRHPDLEFTHFVIPQVPGSMKRSRPVHGVVESVVRAKKYVAVLAAFHPVVAGGVVSVYLVGDRFNPARDARVLNVSGDLQAAPTKDERRAALKELRALEAGNVERGMKERAAAWRNFVDASHPEISEDGQAVLRAPQGEETVTLGVTRQALQIDSSPAELQRDLMISRLKQTLARSRAPRISNSELHADFQLLEKIDDARQAELIRKSDSGNTPVKLPSSRSSD